MLIKCPKCQTVYNLKDNLIQENGLKMRCSQCKEVFKAYPQDAIKEPEKKKKDIPLSTIFGPFSKNTNEIFDTSSVQNQSPKIRIIHLTHYKNKINYILLLMMVLLIGALLYLMRYDIVRYAPGTESLYQKFGIESIKNGLTLDFESITTEELVEDNISKIKVSGIIANTSKYPMRVPPINVIVHSQDGEKLVNITHFLPQKRMNPGYKIPFKIIFKNPNPEQKNIHISFTEKLQGE